MTKEEALAARVERVMALIEKDDPSDADEHEIATTEHVALRDLPAALAVVAAARIEMQAIHRHDHPPISACTSKLCAALTAWDGS